MATDYIGIFLGVGQRATNNLKATFTDLSPQKLIRLVLIVGAYLLFRPYLLKLASRNQLSAHEEADRVEAEAKARGGISVNALRGQVQIPDDSDDEEPQQAGGASSSGAGASGAADWGKKARRRQRNMVKKLLDDHEKKLAADQEEKEDKDIEEFLIKD